MTTTKKRRVVKKAKSKEPAKEAVKQTTGVRFVRYHGPFGAYHGVIKPGRVNMHLLGIDSIPIRVVSLGPDESKYITDLDLGLAAQRIFLCSLADAGERLGIYANARSVLNWAITKYNDACTDDTNKILHAVSNTLTVDEKI